MSFCARDNTRAEGVDKAHLPGHQGWTSRERPLVHPCFWMIRPPTAADGPLPPRLWRRLAVCVSSLALYFMLAMLLAA